MLVWNILHILAMFVAFGFTTGVGIFATAVAQKRDVRTIRAVVPVALSLNTAGVVVLLLGLVFGFATAGAMGFSLSSKWLLIAYALVILLLIIGVGIHRAWAGRLVRAALASPDDQASPELVKVIEAPIVRLAGTITGLLWISLISIMVIRPS